MTRRMEQRVDLMGNALLNVSTLGSDLEPSEREVDDCVTISRPACFHYRGC